MNKTEKEIKSILQDMESQIQDEDLNDSDVMENAINLIKQEIGF